MLTDLVLGTHNAHKVIELQHLLQGLAIQVYSLSDLPTAIEVAETGETFRDNARLKAVQQALHLRKWVLAEDSGLSVDALSGRPGVYSARYAGPGATDGLNNALLLKELAEVPLGQRSAHYTCQTCLASPTGEIVIETTGHCHGFIGVDAQGAAGFGYDPLFVVPEYHRTFAELGPMAKKAISHRARAMRSFLTQFCRLLAGQENKSA